MDQLPAQKKSFFRRELIYLLIVLIAATILGVLVILRLNPQATKLQGADYIEGLPRDKVTVGILEIIVGLYPNVTFDVDSIAINSNMFEGLTMIRGGRLQPALAESWTNPDDLTWKIKLRSGVKFHSGNPLKASDVKYTIEEAKKHPDWFDGIASSIASKVDSVKVIDDQTVELKTKKPDPTLLHWMIYLFISSEDQVKKDGLEKAVGTGPYKLVSIDKKEAVLKANDAYWGGPPKVKNLVYKAYKDARAIADGFEKGEVDVSLFLENAYNEELKNKGFSVIPTKSGDISFLGFNTKMAPFTDIRVRKAILLALDVNKILKGSDRDGQPATQFATADLTGFNKELTRPKTDKEAAKRLLSEAGFANGFTVTLNVPDIAVKEGEQIKTELATIGINVKLNPLAFEEFFAALPSVSFYRLAYVPDTLDSTDLLNSFVHSPTADKGSLNFSGYSNPKLDELLDKASITFNTNERAKIIEQAHKEVMDQLPIVPLVERITFFILREDVSFKPAPFGYIFGFELSGRQKASNNAQ
ncbi:MAG: ABC transporter substrate-binding protein [bacterium]|nr:ABC transporter substrate-binding protein [bacterium]